MESTNYLQNSLSTRSKTHGEMIPEEAWTEWKEDLHHVYIFESLAFYNILEEKG